MKYKSKYQGHYLSICANAQCYNNYFEYYICVYIKNCICSEGETTDERATIVTGMFVDVQHCAKANTEIVVYNYSLSAMPCCPYTRISQVLH